MLDWTTRYLLIAMSLLLAPRAWAVDQSAFSAEASSAPHRLAVEEVRKLFSFGATPQTITIGAIERSFNTDLEADRCDSLNTLCRWYGPLREGNASITNVFVPNSNSDKAGATVALEIPTGACVAVGDVANLTHVIPAEQPVPPPALSYVRGDQEIPSLAMLEYREIPSLHEKVKILAWVSNNCVSRVELEAIVPKEN